MSLTAWAKYQPPADLTLDLLCAIVLFGLIALAIPKGKPQHSPSSASRETSPQVAALQRAIIGQESGGQCSIQNRSGSGAAGLAQIMPENVTTWSQEALGRTVTLTEFLNDCQLQQQIIRFKLQQYWEEEIRASDGDERLAVRRVASRWYSGRADLYDSAAPQFWWSDRYPSVREYTRSVLQQITFTSSSKAISQEDSPCQDCSFRLRSMSNLSLVKRSRRLLPVRLTSGYIHSQKSPKQKF